MAEPEPTPEPTPTMDMSFLSWLCSNCGLTFGDHRGGDDLCPGPDGEDFLLAPGTYWAYNHEDLGNVLTRAKTMIIRTQRWWADGANC